jgi:hypothetical protein
MSGALMLPPTPAAVAAYFAQRRGTLAGFTPDEIQHNEMFWLVGACGLSESEAAALMGDLRIPAAMPTGAALEAENGGSMAEEVIPAAPCPDPRCNACGQPFQPRREWSRYCTVNCKQRAKRARRVGV